MDDSANKSRNINNLLAWQKAMHFAVTICKEMIPALPGEERFALADQLRRAAQSIPANIAEGFGRYHYQEAIRFCYIARGSLVEVYSHLEFARRMNYLTGDVHGSLVNQLEEVHRILNGYISFLKRSKQGAAEWIHEIHDLPEIYTFREDEADDAIQELPKS